MQGEDRALFEHCLASVRDPVSLGMEGGEGSSKTLDLRLSPHKCLHKHLNSKVRSVEHEQGLYPTQPGRYTPMLCPDEQTEAQWVAGRPVGVKSGIIPLERTRK